MFLVWVHWSPWKLDACKPYTWEWELSFVCLGHQSVDQLAEKKGRSTPGLKEVGSPTSQLSKNCHMSLKVCGSTLLLRTTVEGSVVMKMSSALYWATRVFLFYKLPSDEGLEHLLCACVLPAKCRKSSLHEGTPTAERRGSSSVHCRGALAAAT